MSMSAAERHASKGQVTEQYLEPGFNLRMTDIQAAVGLVQLGRLDAMVERRRALAARYRERLGGVAGMQTIVDPPDGRTNFQSFWVLLPEDSLLPRDGVLAHLAEAGISGRRGIMAAHLEPAYAGVQAGPLPVTERITAGSVILPLYHDMNSDDQHRVVDALLEAVGAQS
jgi:perosamine synthetase